MDYPLKNGKTVTLRVPAPEDAAELLQIKAGNINPFVFTCL